MNRKLMCYVMGGFLLALPVTDLAWSKGHVPVKKVQVCLGGNVITVSNQALDAFLEHIPSRGPSACRLPACDFNNIFMAATGCADIIDVDGDGLCDLSDPRESAEGQTPGCPPGTF